MRDGRVIWCLHLVVLSLVSHYFLTAPCSAEEAPFQQATILHHRLFVEIFPDTHELIATDHMTIRVGRRDGRVTFSLAPSLRVQGISTMRDEKGLGLRADIPYETESSQAEPASQRVTVRIPGISELMREGELHLKWQYRGVINDPPREPRHLRFVTPSETSGHIGPEGIYLSSESQWYPDLPGSLARYELDVHVPEGWTAVTQGRQLDRSRWSIEAATEALTLVANKFVTKQREWKDPDGRPIQVVTYLFPENAQLADEYLDATIKYLATYIPILGPYPFPKFAVVENFFASGLGMPSFTLLGSGVIKRHYTQAYALGHEIVHSWIGNSVFNKVDKGNWVEGLTTYLANYYYEELAGTAEQAREQRRMMLLGYAVYVRPEEDYPVAQFRRKTDQKDNAIGYQKAAMVFHMLRREIGDDAFWRGIKTFVAKYNGAYAGWESLERVFSETAGRDLRWFFSQWVERAGAPRVKIDGPVVFQENGAAKPSQAGATRLGVRLIQEGRPYRLRVPLVVKTGERALASVVELKEGRETISIPLPEKPVSLHLDPEFEVFRRLSREHLAPMLNLFVTDRERSLLVPSGGSDAERGPYQELAKQITSRDKGIRAIGDQELKSVKGSALVLGGPGTNEAAEWAVRGCGGKLNLQKDSVTIEGRSFAGPSLALLVSCRHPERPEHIVTLFYGVTPDAAAKVARLLFFYGWQSYVVFREGTVIAKGDWRTDVDGMEITSALEARP
jgi:hypothetical protein